MTKRRFISQLPTIHQTETLQKFFNATVDKVFQPGDAESINAFVGKKPSYFNALSDFYKSEQTKEREIFQLEPTMVAKDQSGAQTSVLFYRDLVNSLRFQGANVSNEHRLFETDLYTWCPPVNIDKLVNYRDYYWMPDGAPVLVLEPNVLTYDGDGVRSTFSVPEPVGTIQPTYSVTVDGLPASFNLVNGEVVLNNAPISGSVVKVWADGNLLSSINGQPESMVYTGKTTVYVEKTIRVGIDNHPELRRFPEVEVSGQPLVRGTRVEIRDSLGTKQYMVDLLGGQINLIDYSSLLSVYEENPRYIVIERLAEPKSMWDRTNSWVHRSLLSYPSEVVSFTKSARPIIEFFGDLKLDSYGLRHIGDVDFVYEGNQFPSDFLDSAEIDPANGLVFDGNVLDDGTKFLVPGMVSNNSATANRIISVNFVESSGLSESALSYDSLKVPYVLDSVNDVFIKVDENSGDFTTWDIGGLEGEYTVEYTVSDPIVADDVVSLKGTQDSIWFDGVVWKDSQSFTTFPLFELYDSNGISFADTTVYPNNEFTGSKIFSYKIGDGENDSVLGFPVSNNSLGGLEFYDFTSDFAGTVFFKRSSYLNGQKKTKFTNTWHPAMVENQTKSGDFYTIPKNLQANATNEQVSTVSTNDWNAHFGNVLRDNTWRHDSRSFDLSSGDQILQSRSSLLRTMLLNTSANIDLSKSMRYVEREYIRFKGKLNQAITAFVNSYGSIDVENDLTTILGSMKTAKTSEFPFANNGMAGGDYFIPPTPAFLGITPLWEPELIVEKTKNGSQLFIRGHDGSLIPGTTSSTDENASLTLVADVLHLGANEVAAKDLMHLEFEQRVYDSASADSHERKMSFDLRDYAPGKFRNSEFTREEFLGIARPMFERWISQNQYKYRTNTIYDQSNPFTWNYSGLVDKDGERLPGFWRGIYRHYFDTDRPHRSPWEMLGYTSKPTWWDTHYSWTDPAKRINLISAIEAGIIDPVTGETDPTYTRPGFTKFVPVSTTGDLLDPIQAGIVLDTGSDYAAGWEFGDGAPVENMWLNSVCSSFTIATMSYLMKPARFVESSWIAHDEARVLDAQWIKKSVGSRSYDRSALIHNETKDGTLTRILGLQTIVSDFVRSQGQSITSSLGAVSRQLGVSLAHKVGGFLDVSATKAYTENSGLIPAENVTVSMYRSPSVREEFYGGAVVEKTARGWRVIGYDAVDPVFKILPVMETGRKTKISVGEDINSVTWVANMYYQVGVMVNYNNRIYQCVKTHTSSTAFESEFWDYTGNEASQSETSAVWYLDHESDVVRIHYGAEMFSVQEVVDFLNGYEAYLVSNGWVFDYYDSDKASVMDWHYASRDFLAWNQINWEIGTFIALSPSSQSVKFQTSWGTVQNVEQMVNGTYSVVDRSGFSVPSSTVTANRMDDSITVGVTTGGIFGLRLFVSEVEQIVVFDNSTIFDDVIYDPLFNVRQQRIRLITLMGKNWVGRLDAPGFVITDNRLVPSFDKQVEDLRYAFDIEQALSLPLRDNARHLIGYQSRSYLENLMYNEVNQFEFYQGMIKQKGAPGVLGKLLRNNELTQTQSLNFLDEWAVRKGVYGAIDRLTNFEFKVKRTGFKVEPQLFNLGSDVDTKTSIVVGQDTWISKPAGTPFKLADDYTMKKGWLPTAGYVRTGEVQYMGPSLQYLKDHLASNRDFQLGDKLWTYGDSFGVFKLVKNGQKDIKISSFVSINEGVLFTTTASHGLQAGDTIYLPKTINDAAEISGFHEVISATDLEFVLDVKVEEDKFYDTSFEPADDVGSIPVIQPVTPPEDITSQFAITTPPLFGTATVDSNGGWVYTPNADYSGDSDVATEDDSFKITYTVNGVGTEYTVNVFLNPVNDAPIAKPDSIVFNDAESTIPESTLIGNDVSPDGDLLRIVSVKSGNGGTATINPDRSITFTPGEFTGIADFEYTISDRDTTDTIAEITVTRKQVTPVTAVTNGGVNVDKGKDVKIYVFDPDGIVDETEIKVVKVPTNGTISIGADGFILYQHNGGGVTSDSFSYTVGGEVEFVGTKKVEVEVDERALLIETKYKLVDVFGERGAQAVLAKGENVFDPLKFISATSSSSVPSTGAVSLEPDGTVKVTAPVGAVWKGEGGTVTLIDNLGTFTEQPTDALVPVEGPYTREVSFKYSLGLSVNVSVNEEPDGLHVEEGTPVTFSAADLGITSGQIVRIEPGLRGDAVLNSDGSVTFTPEEGYVSSNDKATFKCVVTDGELSSTRVNVLVKSKTVTDVTVNEDMTASGNITVEPQNETGTGGVGGPTATNSPIIDEASLGFDVVYGYYKTTAKAKETTTGKVVATDADGDSLSYAISVNPANGTASIDTSGTWSYTPLDTFIGSDGFTVEVSDGNGGVTAVRVVIITSPVDLTPREDIPRVLMVKPMRFTSSDVSVNYLLTNEPSYSSHDKLVDLIGDTANLEVGDILYVDAGYDIKDQFKFDPSTPRWMTLVWNGTTFVVNRMQPKPVVKNNIRDIKLFETQSTRTERTLNAKPLNMGEVLVIDPARGMLPGVAEVELAYILGYDPASYNQGSMEESNTGIRSKDAGSEWANDQVGKLWFDLSTVRFLEAETNSTLDDAELAYRLNSFGKLAPGASVDIYEWTKSMKSPKDWQAAFEAGEYGFDGSVKNPDAPSWVESREWNERAGKYVTNYYFWVKNRDTAPKKDSRKRSAKQVAEMISNPALAGLSFATPLSEYHVVLGNVSQFLSETSSVQFTVEASDSQTPKHVEWKIMRAGDESSLPDQDLWNRLITSLTGKNAWGESLPLSTLPDSERYGFNVETGQSLFKNLKAARRQLVQYINQQFAKSMVVDERRDPIILNVTEEANETQWGQSPNSYYVKPFPVGGFAGGRWEDAVARTSQTIDGTNVTDSSLVYDLIPGESYWTISGPTLWDTDGWGNAWEGDGAGSAYDMTVQSVGEVDSVVVPANQQSVLVYVPGNQETAGAWTLWRKTSAGKTLVQYQRFDTQASWSYVDWYAAGFSADNPPTLTFANVTRRDAALGTNPKVQFVKVLDDGKGRWMWQEFVDGLWVVVAKEKATIKISDSIWENTGNEVDINNFITTYEKRDQGYELNALMNQLREFLFTNKEINGVVFSLISYAHTEQDFVDWCFKTSFMYVTGYRDDLGQKPIANVDLTSSLLSYLDEVKPYHVKVRDFVSKYGLPDEKANGTVTDYDKPTYFDPLLKKLRVLDPENSADVSILKTGIWKSWYDQYKNGNNLVRKLNVSQAYDEFVIVSLSSSVRIKVMKADPGAAPMESVVQSMIAGSTYTVPFSGDAQSSKSIPVFTNGIRQPLDLVQYSSSTRTASIVPATTGNHEILRFGYGAVGAVNDVRYANKTSASVSIDLGYAYIKADDVLVTLNGEFTSSFTILDGVLTVTGPVNGDVQVAVLSADPFNTFARVESKEFTGDQLNSTFTEIMDEAFPSWRTKFPVSDCYVFEVDGLRQAPEFAHSANLNSDNQIIDLPKDPDVTDHPGTSLVDPEKMVLEFAGTRFQVANGVKKRVTIKPEGTPVDLTLIENLTWEQLTNITWDTWFALFGDGELYATTAVSIGFHTDVENLVVIDVAGVLGQPGARIPVGKVLFDSDLTTDIDPTNIDSVGGEVTFENVDFTTWDTWGGDIGDPNGTPEVMISPMNAKLIHYGNYLMVTEDLGVDLVLDVTDSTQIPNNLPTWDWAGKQSGVDFVKIGNTVVSVAEREGLVKVVDFAGQFGMNHQVEAEFPGVARLTITEISSAEAMDARSHSIISTHDRQYALSALAPYAEKFRGGEWVEDGSAYWVTQNGKKLVYGVDFVVQDAEVGFDGQPFGEMSFDRAELLNQGLVDDYGFSNGHPTDITEYDFRPMENQTHNRKEKGFGEFRWEPTRAVLQLKTSVNPGDVILATVFARDPATYRVDTEIFSNDDTSIDNDLVSDTVGYYSLVNAIDHDDTAIAISKHTTPNMTPLVASNLSSGRIWLGRELVTFTSVTIVNDVATLNGVVRGAELTSPDSHRSGKVARSVVNKVLTNVSL